MAKHGLICILFILEYILSDTTRTPLTRGHCSHTVAVWHCDKFGKERELANVMQQFENAAHGFFRF